MRRLLLPLALLVIAGIGVPLGVLLARGDDAGPLGESEPAEPVVDPADFLDVTSPESIPAVDEPKFIAPDEADLPDQEPVLAIDIEGDRRAYPLRIMVWHEIVNDVIGGQPIAVTYCPLCNTGIAYRRPLVEGEPVRFNASGKLFNANLVMFDRETGSLWPQVLGRAVSGPLEGTELEFLPVQILSFGDWRAATPDGRLLSEDTGFLRSYGKNPYESYDNPVLRPFPFGNRKEIDPRLPPKERILGVEAGGAFLAFPFEMLAERAGEGWAAVNAEVGGRPVAVFWKPGTVSAIDDRVIVESRDVGAAAAFDPVVDGRRLTFRGGPDGATDEETGSRWNLLGEAESGPLAGTRLGSLKAFDSFWFDWAAFHPSTGIFGR